MSKGKSFKQTIILTGILFFISLVFFGKYTQIHAGRIQKKKLYISKIKAGNGVSEALANAIRKQLILAIFQKFGRIYQVVSDSDIKIMYKKAEELMKQGCSAEACMTQIADAIDADEIIYGEVNRRAPKLELYVGNLMRNRRTLKIRKKSVVSETFYESELYHYVPQVAMKLINPRHRINRKVPARFSDRVVIKTIKVGRIKGLDISIMKFTSGDRAITRILGVLKSQVEQGDLKYNRSQAGAAREEYLGVLDRIRRKLTPARQQKLAIFIAGIKKRVGATYAMEYRTRIEAVDGRLKRKSTGVQ